MARSIKRVRLQTNTYLRKLMLLTKQIKKRSLRHGLVVPQFPLFCWTYLRSL